MHDRTHSGQTFKERNGLDFKVADAGSYDSVAAQFDQYTARFTRHLPGPMLAMTNLPEAASVLDVGCGSGVVALELASALGKLATVTGVDMSEGMLCRARKNSLRRGVGDRMHFLKMDAESLGLREDSFDAVFSLYALRHFPDPQKSVAEMYRVLKPGGRIVVAVGSGPKLLSAAGVRAGGRRLASVLRRVRGQELTACEFMDGLVMKHLPAPEIDEIAPWVGGRQTFSGSVARLVESAGFVDLRQDWKGQYSIIESVDDFWRLQLTFSSLARKRIEAADETSIDALKSEFFASCERTLSKRGRLVYQTGAAMVAARKP